MTHDAYIKVQRYTVTLRPLNNSMPSHKYLNSTRKKTPQRIGLNLAIKVLPILFVLQLNFIAVASTYTEAEFIFWEKILQKYLPQINAP